VWGKFAAFVLPYYGLALVGALLDFACPAVLVPFKIQEDSWPTLADYAKCTPLVLLNTALLVPLLYMTYPVYRHFATDPLGELPPLWTVILQVPVFISTAEIVFYFPHRWMHTPWAFKHIHHIHHEYTAPIALASVLICSRFNPCSNRKPMPHFRPHWPGCLHLPPSAPSASSASSGRSAHRLLSSRVLLPSRAQVYSHPAELA